MQNFLCFSKTHFFGGITWVIPMNGTTHFLATSVKTNYRQPLTQLPSCAIYLFIYIILFYSIFDLKDILLSLAFDELSWDYTPAPAMEPGCLDTFWLEFDTPGYDGQSLEVQRLQVFSKQVSLALFSLKFEEHWYILRRRTLHTLQWI